MKYIAAPRTVRTIMVETMDGNSETTTDSWAVLRR
jgi:hypothetical protein